MKGIGSPSASCLARIKSISFFTVRWRFSFWWRKKLLVNWESDLMKWLFGDPFFSEVIWEGTLSRNKSFQGSISLSTFTFVWVKKTDCRWKIKLFNDSWDDRRFIVAQNYPNSLKQKSLITKPTTQTFQTTLDSGKLFTISPPGTDPSFCFIALLWYINMIVPYEELHVC